MTVMPTAWAQFSPCGQYRYLLGRRVASTGSRGLVCMLNPSSAGAYKPDGKTEQSDPTIATLKKRAVQWGWASFEVVNLFAMISSDPEDVVGVLCAGQDAVGPLNDVTVCGAAARADVTVVAWGAAAARFAPDRVQFVLQMLSRRDVFCIGRSAGGAPKHPMARGRQRVPETTPLELFRSMEV